MENLANGVNGVHVPVTSLLSETENVIIQRQLLEEKIATAKKLKKKSAQV